MRPCLFSDKKTTSAGWRTRFKEQRRKGNKLSHVDVYVFCKAGFLEFADLKKILRYKEPLIAVNEDDFVCVCVCVCVCVRPCACVCVRACVCV
jgi:hypothetical protein